MRPTDEGSTLHVEVETKQCEISQAEQEKMRIALAPLERVVDGFPVAGLIVTVNHHLRGNDYHVKTSLVLTGKTLFTGERHEQMYTAFERCVQKLVNKVNTYKHVMSNTSEVAKHEKGTHQEVMPTHEPDTATLEKAVSSGDYNAFRRATLPYEEPVRKRIGRWVQRYPELDAQIGARLTLEDIVEDVFLSAFDSYPHRPPSVSLSEWLEGLIDPSIKAILHHPDEELENINFARTLRAAEPANG